MMGKAHIAVGIASALVIAFPENVMQFALAVAGGAIGGIASDIDIKSNAHTKDARQSRIIAFIVAFLAIIAGCIYDTIVTLDYESAPLAEMGIGLLIVIPTAIAMRRSSHRGVQPFDFGRGHLHIWPSFYQYYICARFLSQFCIARAPRPNE